MNSRLVALSLALLGATVFVWSAQAQRHGSRTGAAVSRSGVRTVRQRRDRRFFSGSAFAPYFYPDDDYSLYDSDPGIEAPPSQIIGAQAARPASPTPVANQPESLVLELQGDHWVRVTPYGPPQIVGQSNQPERASNQPTALPPTTRRRTAAAKPPSELPPAVLVFRDGHQEEIGNYTIMGATIYVSADYWNSGSWTRKVQIAELDVPATLKLNQERGANFRLPSGPDQVMIRP